MSFLRPFAIFLGLLCTLVSVFSIGCVLYLLFGDPNAEFTLGTYRPSWEDVGPALACSVLSLLFAVMLMGGALQYSKNLILAWLIWTMVLLVVFWLWYGYNQLKHYGYIEWGVQGCHFCGRDVESTVSLGGAVATFILFVAMVPVAILHGKFKRRHREMTDLNYLYDPYTQYQQQHQQQQQQQIPYQMQYPRYPPAQPQQQLHPYQQQQQYHQYNQNMMEYKF